MTASCDNSPCTPAGLHPQSAQEHPPAALLDEVRNLLPVLPVLAAQLREVVRQVEDSVIGVCGNFQAMAAKARQAVTQSALLSDDAERPSSADDGGIPALVASTRETLGSLLQRIEQSSRFSQRTVEQMQTLDRHMQALLANLHEIDEVAKSARILALNGQIEASRAGAHGAAFSVVAKETANMAKHAVASSTTIREELETVAANIEGASTALRDRASADFEEAARSREEVHRTLDAMATLHAEMERAMAESRRNTESLARDISAAVMALQFQDAVSQRIGHVSSTLDELHASLARYAGGGGASSGDALPAVLQDWAAKIASEYTMESERAVHAAHGAAATAATEDPDSNVELF